MYKVVVQKIYSFKDGRTDNTCVDFFCVDELGYKEVVCGAPIAGLTMTLRSNNGEYWICESNHEKAIEGEVCLPVAITGKTDVHIVSFNRVLSRQEDLGQYLVDKVNRLKKVFRVFKYMGVYKE